MSWREGETTVERGPRRHSPSRWVLRVVSTPDAEAPREVALRSSVEIGRAPSASDGLAILDAHLSRSHLVLRDDPRGGLLTDSSTNGTFVNGARVKTAIVGDGDVVRAGDSFFVLRNVPVDARDVHVPELVGTAPAMMEVREAIAIVAPARASVLIEGESGTGKEIVARTIHARSGRHWRFVAVNCSAIPESLAESQIFGHVAGAFTGAREAHQGLFRQAHEGTLFLDELGEMPLAIQAKLLRAIEDRAVVPVGSDRPVPVDVRIVSATNRALSRAVREERFRGDLFARLGDLLLHTPPLRERREDILPILARGLGDGAPPLSPELVEALLLYDWPFNVRELLKVGAELALRGAGRDRLELELVERRLARGGAQRPPSSDMPAVSGPAPASSPPPPPSAEAPTPGAPTERPHPPHPRAAPPTRDEIAAAWREHGGNVSAIARALGRSRRQARRYLEDLGLRVEGDGNTDG